METVLDVLERAARSHGERPAMQVKRGGVWQSTTWAEYREQVRLAARGLIALGLSPGQGVAIMGFNRPEWFVANVAAMAAGGLPAGIYTTNTAEQCRYIAEHAEAAVAILENADYLARFLEVEARLPKLKAIVMMEGDDHDDILSWPSLLERGAQLPEEQLEQRIAKVKPTQTATLIYTSGTTGPPKAVMLSHENIVWTARQVAERTGLRAGDRILSYLPLCHIAEQLVSHHPPMVVGGCTAFAESVEKLPDNLREVRPDLFFGVPRVWEKIQAAIQAAGATRPAVARRIAAWARRVGLASGYADQQGRSRPLLHPLARRLVFEPVRRKLGLDRARLCACSAAPIAKETLEFFLGLGIPILEVYGMSECTGPATLSLPGDYRTGRAGRAIAGSELRIAEDGEILMRGPHVFRGYYRDEAATRETLDGEGWLHSGDIGQLDGDGFLKVTDRKKELLITAGGKNIAPQHLEGLLRQIPAVSQAVVIGDRRPFVTALLTLDVARLPAEAAAARSEARTPEQAARCAAFRAYLEGQVSAVNATLARYESIKRFAILPVELTVDGGELTPTMKLKRRVIGERFSAEIEGLYSG